MCGAILKKRPKCDSKKQSANAPKTWDRAFCSGLDSVLEPELSNGFSPYVLTKLWGERAGEKNLAGIIWRPNQKTQPTLLSFCPFCGASFAAWLKPHLKKAARKKGI